MEYNEITVVTHYHLYVLERVLIYELQRTSRRPSLMVRCRLITSMDCDPAGNREAQNGTLAADQNSFQL